MAKAIEVSDEEENGGTSGSPMDITNAGTGIGTGGAQAPKAAGSGSFTNIQDYVKANKPKIKELSQGITKDVQKESQGLRQGLEKTRSEYLGQEGKFGAGQQDFIKKQIDQAGTGTQTQEDADRFAKLREGTTQAPDLSKQRQQASDIQRRNKEFQTSKGRQEGLRRLVGGKTSTYGKGQQKLDNMLLAGDRASKQKSIRDIREASKGLGQQVGTLDRDLAVNRSALKEAAGGAETARKGLSQEVTDRYRGLESGLEGGTLTDEQYAQLGLTKGERTYGGDLLGTLNQTRGMSQADISRLDALSKLSGGQRQTFADIEQGGDSAANLRAMLDEQKATYQSAIDPFNTAVNTQQAMYDTTAYRHGGGYQTDTQKYILDQEIAKRDAMEAQYTGTAKDGGIMGDPKRAALKKLRGY